MVAVRVIVRLFFSLITFKIKYLSKPKRPYHYLIIDIG
jgi:hypothetical protein